jgi:MATE family multidrug resistance protein
VKISFFKKSLQDIIILSYPIILAQVGTILMGISDTIMLGNIGKIEVAASGVANQIYFLFTSLGMGTLTAMAPMVASSKGAKNQQECGEILRTGIELSFILSIIICILLYIIGENFQIFNQPSEITETVRKYLRILTISTIPLMLFLSLKQFSDGLSFAKPAMLITLIAVLLNIFFNWVFIYGNLTFPQMGAYGAAIATLLARIMMALLLVIYIFRSSIYKAFLPPLISTFNTKPVLIKMFKVGFPGGLQMFFEIGAFAGAAVFVGWLGTTELAAHQIALALAAITYMVGAGISAAGSVKVASAFGQNDKEMIKTQGNVSLLAVTLFMCVTGLSFFLFNYQLVGMFIKDQMVIQLGASIVLIAALFQLSDGLQVVALGILRGIEDVNKPTLITMISYWIIALPLAYVLGFVFHYGVMGIWWGLFAGLTSSAFLLTTRFFNLVTTGKTKSYVPTKLDKI